MNYILCYQGYQGSYLLLTMVTVEDTDYSFVPDILDNIEYISLPKFIMSTKALVSSIKPLSCTYIKEHKLIATHCQPAFSPKTSILP